MTLSEDPHALWRSLQAERDRLPGDTVAPVAADDDGAVVYAVARKTILARAGRKCELCHRGLTLESMHAHHRLPRSARRMDCPCNLLALCGQCHAHVHAQPAESRGYGLIVSRNDRRVPAAIPVTTPWVTVLLHCDGSKRRIPPAPLRGRRQRRDNTRR